MIRARLVKFVALGVVAAAGGAAVAVQAAADFSEAVAVDISDATFASTPNPDGTCDWTVNYRLKLINLTDEPIETTGVRYTVTFTGPDGLNGVRDATSDPQITTVGDTLGADERRDYGPATASFTIPCEAADGDFVVHVTTPLGRVSGDAPFLVDGTPIPITGPVGALGVSGVLGAGAYLAYRHRRRHGSAAA